jgi:hypothetical protein
MGERRITLVLVVLFVALLAPPARGALFMEFDPPRGRPGTIVTGRTAGEGALTGGTGRRFLVYLDSLETKDWIPIGHVAVDKRGNGTLEFEVPDVPGGKYTVLMSCPPCAPYSAGRTEVPIGDFTVIGPPPPAPPPEEESWVPLGIALTGVAVLVLVGFVRRGRIPQPH